MRRTTSIIVISLGFLFLHSTVFAQLKVSADTKKEVASGSAGTSVNAESSAEAAAKPDAQSSIPGTKTGVTVEAVGTAESATDTEAAESTSSETASEEASSDAGAEPVEETSGQTTTSAEADQAVDTSTYSVRLRDLEQRINELKEQVFRSKARLSLLAETILQGAVSGSQSRLIHENKMGSSYLLVKAVYALDGAPIYNKIDEEGGLNDRKSFDIYNGSIVPGEHTITANLEYRGRGFGIFSYLKGYRFKVKSSYTFNAPEGKAITLRIVSYEKGGPTTPLEERPAVRYLERLTATGAMASADDKGGK